MWHDEDDWHFPEPEPVRLPWDRHWFATWCRVFFLRAQALRERLTSAPDFFRRPRLARRTRGPEWSGKNFCKA